MISGVRSIFAVVGPPAFFVIGPPVLFSVAPTRLIVAVALPSGLILRRDDTVRVTATVNIDIITVTARPFTHLNHFGHIVLHCGSP
jgi:hypothetical protein